MQEDSPIRQMAMNIAKEFNAIAQDCSEEELMRNADKIYKEYNPEYINPKLYCNVDKALDILGLKGNRKKFFKLIKDYGIKTTKINNQPIGYKITEIETLKSHIK